MKKEDLFDYFEKVKEGTRGSDTSTSQIIYYKNGNSISFSQFAEEYEKYKNLDKEIEKYTENNNLDSIKDADKIKEHFKDKIDKELFLHEYGYLKNFTSYMITKIEKANENYKTVYHEREKEIQVNELDKVESTVEEDAKKFNYMMLDRLRSDCEYFLGNGNGYVGHLYYKDIDTHIEEMKKLYNSFSDEEKPEWINLKDIDTYKEKMTQMLEKTQDEEEL